MRKACRTFDTHKKVCAKTNFSSKLEYGKVKQICRKTIDPFTLCAYAFLSFKVENARRTNVKAKKKKTCAHTHNG